MPGRGKSTRKGPGVDARWPSQGSSGGITSCSENNADRAAQGRLAAPGTFLGGGLTSSGASGVPRGQVGQQVHHG